MQNTPTYTAPADRQSPSAHPWDSHPSRSPATDPSLLILNVSGERAGERVEKVLAGLASYYRDVTADRSPLAAPEVALVVFGGWGQVVQDYVVAPNWPLSRKPNEGVHSFDSAILQSMEERGKGTPPEPNGEMEWGRPWVFIITKGEASDPQSHCWEQAKKLLNEGQGRPTPILIGIRL